LLRGPYLLRIRFDAPVIVRLEQRQTRWETLTLSNGNSEQLVRINGHARLVVEGEANGDAQVVPWTGGPA